MAGWILRCDGQDVDEFDEINEAIQVGDEHIRRACPQAFRFRSGATTEWHLDEATDVWSAASGPVWLNHDIVPIPGGDW